MEVKFQCETWRGYSTHGTPWINEHCVVYDRNSWLILYSMQTYTMWSGLREELATYCSVSTMVNALSKGEMDDVEDRYLTIQE